MSTRILTINNDQKKLVFLGPAGRGKWLLEIFISDYDYDYVRFEMPTITTRFLVIVIVNKRRRI